MDNVGLSSDALTLVDGELQLFAKSAKSWFSNKDRSFLWTFHRFFKEFFTKDRIARAEWTDFKLIGDHIHAMNELAMAKARAFGKPNYSMEQYRYTFDRIAFGPGSIEEKMRWFLTSDDAASKYIGKAAISEILAQLNPEDCIMMNKRDRDAIEHLKLDPLAPKGLDAAAKFARANNIIRLIFPRYEKLVERQTDLPIGLEIDQFLSWIYETRLSNDQTPSPPKDVSRVWLFSPGTNAGKMDLLHKAGEIGIGWEKLEDLRKYKSTEGIINAILFHYPDKQRRPTNNAKTCWDFANTIKEGDLVFARKGRQHIVAWGIVRGPYTYDSAIVFPNRRKVEWKAIGNWTLPPELRFDMKTTTDISENTDLVQILIDLVQSSSEIPPESIKTPGSDGAPLPYNLDLAAEDIFIPKDTISDIVTRLLRKRNIILQGPPGVGKTFVARRIAWLLMEERDDNRVAMVQFHQTMGYEDFVQGFRPKENSQGFQLVDGSFMDFCSIARKDPGRKYVFIIDEINRGHISKIFGELLMLIEHDKRDSKFAVRLAYQKYGDDKFYVPSNVYIVGLMNTADRSLALVDHALRRRFSFIDISPAFDDPVLLDWLRRYWEDEVAETIVLRLSELNKIISGDHDLGMGYRIGHSHFCDQLPSIRQGWEDYRQVILNDISPLLREYWFDRISVFEDRQSVLLSEID